ncbi:MAG: leucine-rich repeat domain-containing protein [Rikenellaceae bacterium]
MRRQIFYLMAVLATVSFSGCQEASVNADLESGNAVKATISAQALTGAEATKAELSELVYYLEIYSGDALYEDLGSSTSGEFSTSLITGLDYTFVAWADYGMGFYDAAGEAGEANLASVNVDLTAYAINDECRDAFAGTCVVEKFDGSAISFTLTRPFARINVATTDITDNMAGFLPTDVKLDYTTALYTSYNVLTGEVNETTSTLTTSVTEFVNETGSISFDYLFAPTAGGVADFTAFFIKDGSEISSYTFTNIPYKQNYQTNISGSLLTTQGDITIDVTDSWEDEIDETITVYETTTVALLQAGIYPTSDYWEIIDETIPDNAFYYNTLSVGNRQITIYCPNATSIGESAFSRDSYLISIECPNVITIGDNAFNYCTKLTTVEFINAITIGSCAFMSSEVLSTVILPNVTTVEFSAFNNCNELVVLELPEALTIGDDCFKDARALTELYLPKVILLGVWALANTQLVTLDLPNVESVGKYAFYYCDDLLTLSMPKLTSIGYCSLQSCKVLTSLTIATESTLTEIGEDVLSFTTPANINLTIGSSNEGVDVDAKTWNGYTFNSITVI